MIKIKKEENSTGFNNEIKNEIREFFDNKQILTLQEENRFLKTSLFNMKTEMTKFKEIPLLVCDIKRVVDGKAIIKIPNGNCFYVNVANGINVNSGDSVLVEQKSLTVIKKLNKAKNFDVEAFVIVEKPSVNWGDIGGLNSQINELKEVVELPLEKPELFRRIGISPPKGVLLYGEPGTGKTLLAKAVATSCNATFIGIVASELVQKYIGDGAKLVKDIFQLAREKKPAIIFIDEIDALAAKRLDIGTSGEREVQRTFMQLLSEIDGFNNLDNVKVIAATNRIDILDPAVLRPGRFDRLIEVPLPEKEGRKHIFNIHSKEMSLDGIDFESLLDKTENFSGADIKAVCTEAGYFAIRENRDKVLTDDFIKAVKKVNVVDELEKDAVSMFG